MKFLSSRHTVKDRQIKGFAGTFGSTGERFQSYEDLTNSLAGSACEMIYADASKLPDSQMISALCKKSHLILSSDQSAAQSNHSIISSLLTTGNAWINPCKDPFVRDMLLRFCILNLRSGNRISAESLFGWGAKKLTQLAQGPKLVESLKKLKPWEPVLNQFSHFLNQVEILCRNYQQSVSDIKYLHDGNQFGVIVTIPTSDPQNSFAASLVQELIKGQLNGMISNIRPDDIEICKLYTDSEISDSQQKPETTVFIK